ncbi:LuxR C-terminal-related transcriptional regulator, partial [Dactylosporangium sp. NPDC005572]|uniref:LuxR C-terminal-related transcriptional regulator n=1 Tax=Dactylosporangium sp. NPDC005572 TaxID=3156889 RepID=UPI0033A873EE
TSEPATSEPATSEPATSEPATSEPAALGPAALSPAASGSVQPSVGEPLGAFAREVREALRRDQPLHARALLGRWLPAARERGPVAHAGAVRYRAMTELQSGALDAAARHAEEVHRTLAGHGATGAVDAGWADVVLAAVHIQRDELDAAAERLDTLAVRLWHGDPALTGAEYLQLAMIDQQRGEVGAALRTTRRLLHDGLPVPPEVHRLHVELLLAAGYHADAQRHAGRYAGNLTRSAGRLVRVRLLLTRPPTADVVADGQRLLRPVAQRPDHPLLHRIEALLLLARLAARAGDAAHAANLRRQAHDLAAPARIVRPFLLEPSLQSPGPPPPPAASHRPLPPPTTHAPTQPATAQGPTLPRTPHAPTPPAAGQGPTPPGTPHGPTPRAAPPGQASPPTPHAPTPPGNPHGPMPPGARRGPAEPAAGAAAVPHDAASPDGAVAAAVDGGDGITRSELLVLRRLAGLFTVTEIAADLHVSANTVKTHLAHIYRKLGVHRRRDAVVRAHELGLL